MDKLQQQREADGIPADPIANEELITIMDQILQSGSDLSGDYYQLPAEILKDILLRTYYAGRNRGQRDVGNAFRQRR